MEGPTEPERPYVVFVSTRFLVLGLLSSMLLAFSVGRAARVILLEGPRRALLAPHDQSTLRNRPDYHEGYARLDASLPPPIAKRGSAVPKTVYTSKNFDTARSATSSSLLIRRSEDDEEIEAVDNSVCGKNDDGTKQCSRGKVKVADASDSDKDEDDDDDDEHLPAGQHLLVDIKNVESAFLDSEERLAHAMIEVVNEASLTLLSYHCHALVPAGVSCVGVLLESHVSFHTWPAEGVITLDLFTCGSNPLVPVVPIIERLFGVPRKPLSDGEAVDAPVSQWAHKLRGFRPEKSRGPLDEWDLGVNLLGTIDLDMKDKVASVQTDYQRVDIYDVIFPRFNTKAMYERSLSGDGSYESLHPELYLPDRLVFLDGVLQSRRHGDGPYHEALVHPAMFAHSNPERVAIIGGGEGATLREVLKHRTVKEAIMVEIDEMMVNVSRSNLPAWSDCSNLVGSAAWCGDDPRSRMYYEDALGWFIDRYSGDVKEESQIDVIIMDALDPEREVPFAQALYNNPAFLKSLFDSLSDDGIIVMQLGAAPWNDDPPEMLTRFKNRARITALLEKAGFSSIHVYDESHCGFFDPWGYVVAFKDYSTRANWYASESEIAVEMHRRAMPTTSGESPFTYFDGATMASYQVPGRAWQYVFCRQEPTPEECFRRELGIDLETPNAPISSFEVKKSGVGEKAGRGVFAKVDIKEGSYIGLEEAVHPVIFPPKTFDIMQSIHDTFGTDSLMEYANGYGFHTSIQGTQSATVDSDIMTFVNHGCNGTYNIGVHTDVNEFTISIDDPPENLLGRSESVHLFNPAVDRGYVYVNGGPNAALRDIRAGEEILDNYLLFIGTGDYWEADVTGLRNQCLGQAGDVVEYEEAEE